MLAATSPGAERRHLAVVFADLVGSTQLSQRLDPEDLRDVVSAYHEGVRTAVQGYGGHIAMLLGDGVISYFGFPNAQEHDVERAVRAGLAIVDAVRALGAGPDARHRAGLAVRVGVHAGEVVVGQADGLGADIFGEVPNVAARLQGLAPPNAVVISAAVQRLVQGLFRVEDLGAHRLHGVEAPVAVYRVVSPSGVRSRLDLAGEAGLTPFVGRRAEIDWLLGRWAETRASGGRAIVVSGEAGIGKSRLVHAFRSRIAETPHTWLECGGSPYTQDSAFHPVIELQASGLGFAPDDDAEQKLRKVEAALERADFSLADTVPLIAGLHSIPLPGRYAHALPLPGRYASIGLTPDAIRRKTKEVARDWLLRMSRQQPVVLLIEDLHWVDPSSLDLVGEILAKLADTQALLVLTQRPSFVLPWPLPAHASSLVLGRLEPDDATRVVTSTAAGRLPEAWIEEIVAKTDGVPLFLEEMTRAALEAGGTKPRLDVPATLKGLLLARLDQLGEAREAAQLGAVIGREFSYELLRTVWPGEEPALRDALARLTAAELLYRRAEAQPEGYVFKHALVQEAAYESLLKAERHALHERIGTVLEEGFATLVELKPELLAHHFSEAQRPERAIPYWYRAAKGGLERSANVEAIRHLTRGIACTEQLPPGPARDAIELGLRTQLAANLIAVKGYAAPEMLDACVRARELCSVLGESPDIFPVLFALWLFHLVRSDRATTRDLAAQMMAFAEQVGDEELLCRAHVATAITNHWQGNFRVAREHAIATRATFAPDRRNLATYGDDPETYGYIYDGMPSWFLGHAEEARARMAEGLGVAERLGYAFTIAGVLSFTTQMHQLAGDVDRTFELAERAIALSIEQGFPLWLGAALVHRGWVFLRRGDPPAAIAEIERGLGTYRATGAMLNVHYFLGLLAEARLVTGERARGLATVDEALGLTDKHLDANFAPELLRLKGDLLLLAPADDVTAEVCYRRALALAQQQDAAYHELRAATSLAKLLAARGQPAAAREILGTAAGRAAAGAPHDREAADRVLASLGAAAAPRP